MAHKECSKLMVYINIPSAKVYKSWCTNWECRKTIANSYPCTHSNQFIFDAIHCLNLFSIFSLFILLGSLAFKLKLGPKDGIEWDYLEGWDYCFTDKLNWDYLVYLISKHLMQNRVAQSSRYCCTVGNCLRDLSRIINSSDSCRWCFRGLRQRSSDYILWFHFATETDNISSRQQQQQQQQRQQLQLSQRNKTTWQHFELGKRGGEREGIRGDVANCGHKPCCVAVELPTSGKSTAFSSCLLMAQLSLSPSLCISLSLCSADSLIYNRWLVTPKEVNKKRIACWKHLFKTFIEQTRPISAFRFANL